MDRCSTDMDDMWSSLDFTIHQPKREPVDSDTTAMSTTSVKKEWYVKQQHIKTLFENKKNLLIY